MLLHCKVVSDSSVIMPINLHTRLHIIPIITHLPPTILHFIQNLRINRYLIIPHNNPIISPPLIVQTHPLMIANLLNSIALVRISSENLLYEITTVR